MDLHIHAPQPDMKAIGYKLCLDCGWMSRFVQFHTPWYGWDSTCLKCGRHYSDGEWMPLDFVRQSRQKSIDHAKARYRRTKINLEAE